MSRSSPWVQPWPSAALAVLSAMLAGCTVPPHVPPFASRPYEPFSRSAVVAIAMTEWRAFGAPVDDDPTAPRPPPPPMAKPERAEGLWQRVGEYWWQGLNPGAPQSGWTGKHDATGRVFPADDDAHFAWSAAFISYVMRLAGAGRRFPYAAAHHVFINAARRVSLGMTRRWIISAERPDVYPPRPGDLVCYSRTPRPLSFDALPAGAFLAHCDIVVAAEAGRLAVIGGNVDDAVTLSHVSVAADGRLAVPGSPPMDARPWLAVLRLIESDPPDGAAQPAR